MDVVVYCASSEQAPQHYRDTAHRLGRLLAESGHGVVFGGGRRGSMGALAAGALEAGGRTHGVIPGFMREREWAHEGLCELEVVPDMHTRKRRMLELSQAVIALPGGCGTFEELLEAVTWKRLGKLPHPVLIVDPTDYYRPLLELFERSIDERFMAQQHGEMWTVVRDLEDVPRLLAETPPWPADAIDFAQH